MALRSTSFRLSFLSTDDTLALNGHNTIATIVFVEIKLHYKQKYLCQVKTRP